MSSVSNKPVLSQSSPAKLASYLPLRTVRIREAVPVLQAVQRAPSLAGLAQLARRSAQCLQLVTPLIPAPMRSAVQAGPLDAGQWCLLAANSAVAAKLRQLAPALAAHLRTHGQEVQEIRIKTVMRNSH
jgi:Dna[CI] antecedent, DciA